MAFLFPTAVRRRFLALLGFLALLFVSLGVTPASASVTVTVSPSSPTLCSGGSQTFTATPSTSSCEGTPGAPSYQWSVDGNAVSGATSSQYAYTASGSGNHTVSCAVTVTSCGSGTGTASVSLSAGGLTLSSASGSPQSATTCQSVTFSANASENCGSGSISYSWNFGDGSPAQSGSSVQHTFGSAGTYNVVVTASDGTSTKTFPVTETITAGSIPSAAPSNVQITSSTATQISLSWTAVSGATTYNVYRSTNGGAFSNVGSATGASYSDSSVSASTSYCYQISAVNSCGEGPQSSPSVCGSTPAAPCVDTLKISSDTATPTTAAVNQPVKFAASASSSCGGAVTYSWDFGDGTPVGAGSSVTHSYTAAKTDSNGNPVPYTVTLTVTDSSTTKTTTLQVTVDAGLPRYPDPGDDPGPEQCMNDFQTDGFSGNGDSEADDPIATRGYPLAWSINVNTQAVDLNRPLANAAFTYDIHVGTQTVYNGTCTGASHWLVVGGNGRRLDFGPSSGSPAPTGGVFSSLTGQPGSGYTLAGAGPPTNINVAGDFTYSFDGSGRLTQITDPQGNAQVVSYSGSQLAQVLDVSTGKNLSFAWTGNQITTIKDNPNGSGTALAQTVLGYSSNARLTSVQAQDGTGKLMTSWQYGYYSDGTLQSVTRDSDNTTTVTVAYTPHASTDCSTPVLMANMTSSKGSSHMVWGVVLTGGTTGTADTVYNTNVNGGKTRYDYNTFGNLIRILSPLPAGATSAPTETMTYDTGGQREVLKDTDGLLSEQFSYTGNGLLQSQSKTYNGATQVWTNTYNGADLLTSQDPVQAAVGVMDSWAYGDAAQPHIATSHTDADGNTWNLAHNTHGQITKVTPPSGAPTGSSSVTYDETAGSPTLGYPLSATDGAGDLTTNDAYDSLGDLLAVSTYPVVGSTTTKETTLLAYDGLQRVTKVTHPDSHTFQSAYNGRNLASTTDEAGTQYLFSYCACGALTNTSGPLGWSLGWSYDNDHELTSFTDANGRQTLYTNGLDDELDKVTYPDSSTVSYGYNNYELLAQTTNGRGDVTNLGYDGAERLNAETFSTTGQPSLGFSYNNDDTLAGFTDGAGTTAYTYDPAGRVTKVIYNYTGSGLANAQELDYTYYPDGLRSTLTWKNGTATVGTWTYNYDAAGRLNVLTNPFNEVTAWAYDGEGKLSSQTNQNGTSILYGYNNQRGWVTSLTEKTGANVTASYALTYDQGNNTVGNLTGVTEADGSTDTYGYDALYRLTSEARTGTSAGSHAYGYDLAGNLTNLDGTTVNYDAANKINSFAGQQGFFSYDNDGDQSTNNLSNSSFNWDDRSELTSRNFGSTNMTYTYDATGRRVHTVNSFRGQAQANTFFVYDGSKLLGEVSSAGAVTAAYTWGADGLVSEHLSPVGGPAQSLWYLYGPQGETRQLTNSSGTVTDTYSYTAYGKTISASTNDANPFQYGGKFGYYTETNGLILCGHRWYDALITLRWLSRDPIGYDGGDNLYAYCGGDPVNDDDDDGYKRHRHHHHPKPVHHPKKCPPAEELSPFQQSLLGIDWGRTNEMNEGVLGFAGGFGGVALGAPEVPVTGGMSPLLLGSIGTGAGIEAGGELTDFEKEYVKWLMEHPNQRNGNTPDRFGIGQGGPNPYGPPVQPPPGLQQNGNPGMGTTHNY